MSFDIVIPIGPSDSSVISAQLSFTKRNVLGYRNIYLVSHDKNLFIDGCITIDEGIFDMKRHIVDRLGETRRTGWYLQQLIKLYAGTIIPGILPRYLALDADTFFLKPTTFVDSHRCLYAFGDEHHLPYFSHMKRLYPSFERQIANTSGICHHMMFETRFLVEMFQMVERHNSCPFYEAFIKHVEPEHSLGSGASEYETYFNYIVKYHRDEIVIRQLKWKNSSNIPQGSDYDYVSVHWYLR